MTRARCGYDTLRGNAESSVRTCSANCCGSVNWSPPSSVQQEREVAVLITTIEIMPGRVCVSLELVVGASKLTKPHFSKQKLLQKLLQKQSAQAQVEM